MEASKQRILEGRTVSPPPRAPAKEPRAPASRVDLGQMGRELITEGPNFVGCTFSEACRDQQFLEKAKGWRLTTGSAQRRRLAAFARCMSNLRDVPLLPEDVGSFPSAGGPTPVHTGAPAEPDAAGGGYRRTADLPLVVMRPSGATVTMPPVATRDLNPDEHLSIQRQRLVEFGTAVKVKGLTLFAAAVELFLNVVLSPKGALISIALMLVFPLAVRALFRTTLRVTWWMAMQALGSMVESICYEILACGEYFVDCLHGFEIWFVDCVYDWMHVLTGGYWRDADEHGYSTGETTPGGAFATNYTREHPPTRPTTKVPFVGMVFTGLAWWMCGGVVRGR